MDLHITPAGRDSSEGAIKETGLLAGQPSAILRCGHVDREEDARDNGDERREHDVRRIRKNKEKKAKGCDESSLRPPALFIEGSHHDDQYNRSIRRVGRLSRTV